MQGFLGWPLWHRRLAASGRHLNVLIADADVRVRGELEEFLCRQGCHTFFASDGTKALRCLTMSRDPSRNLGRIDVVIADADLPGRSGIDILMTARGNDWGVAVVLTSAFAEPDMRSELTRLGAAAVLAKPVSLSQLEDALVRIVEAERGS
jgi:DNA-binding NtrC family response regulator